MPTIQLSVQNTGSVLPTVSLQGGIDIPFPQFRCLIQLPNTPLPKDAVIDTGAPIIWFPEELWSRFRVGTDFEWLPYAPGVRSPTSQIGSWRFTFRMARFLAPLALMDYSTEIERPEVIAAFASGNPPVPRWRQAPPPIIIGVWGGLLEGGRIGIACDPATGRVAGEIAFA